MNTYKELYYWYVDNKTPELLLYKLFYFKYNDYSNEYLTNGFRTTFRTVVNRLLEKQFYHIDNMSSFEQVLLLIKYKYDEAVKELDYTQLFSLVQDTFAKYCYGNIELQHYQESYVVLRLLCDVQHLTTHFVGINSIDVADSRIKNIALSMYLNPITKILFKNALSKHYFDTYDEGLKTLLVDIIHDINVPLSVFIIILKNVIEDTQSILNYMKMFSEVHNINIDYLNE